MKEETLLILIPSAFLVLVFVWGLIAFSLLYRKFRKRKLRLIESTFAELVSKHLYESSSRASSFLHVQRMFRRIGITEKSPENVQYLIDLMIRTQRSLLGRNHDRIKLLYDQIPPYKASFKKTQHKHWYIRARGIREIYEMNQSQYVQYIAKFRNDPNIFIRRESQIALVVFLGWKSLRFLPYLSHKLELWQQIKIVEKMHDLYPVANLDAIREAYKTENQDGKELLMRIIRKYSLESEVDFIVSHLSADSFDLRETSIYCLASFEIKGAHMEKVKSVILDLDNFHQQKQVLKIILNSSKVDDLPFYLNLLNVAHDMLKLRVAEVLWNKGYVEEVQRFYLDQYGVDQDLEQIPEVLTEA